MPQPWITAKPSRRSQGKDISGQRVKKIMNICHKLSHFIPSLIIVTFFSLLHSIGYLEFPICCLRFLPLKRYHHSSKNLISTFLVLLYFPFLLHFPFMCSYCQNFQILKINFRSISLKYYFLVSSLHLWSIYWLAFQLSLMLTHLSADFSLFFSYKLSFPKRYQLNFFFSSVSLFMTINICFITYFVRLSI